MLVLKDKAVLRFTKNNENAGQSNLFVIDYDDSNGSSLCLVKSPRAHVVNKECLQSYVSAESPKFTISKSTGSVYHMNDNSVQRVQFPLCNYVALKVHKIMGDRFASLATPIS